MADKYDKDYFELYALLNLVYCYDESLASLKKCEKPDWISEELSIGLEITRALSPKDGERWKLINKYFGKGYSFEEIREKTNSELKYNNNFFKNVNGIAYCEEIVNYKNVKSLIVDAIRCKLNKMNDGYKTFNNNWLYVFSEVSLLENFEIKDICNEIQKVVNEWNYKYVFNKIFINSIDELYIIENMSEISKIEIPSTVLGRIKSDAINKNVLGVENE